MADKTIIAKVTLGVPCPRKSVLKKGVDGKPVPGEYESVELMHVEPGKSLTVAAEEADRLIALGFAEPPKKLESKKTGE